ncbi:hypothetical protein, partial [Selenomonas sp.]|uniref:hypothetical protein n=1 Tax=Selenomonas sp. TaxID=2053611 RepID=UPI0025E14FBE
MGFFNFGKPKEPLYNQQAKEKALAKETAKPVAQARVPQPAASSHKPAAASNDKQLAYGIEYLDTRMNELTEAEAGIAEYIRKMSETYAGIGQVNEDFSSLNEN